METQHTHFKQLEKLYIDLLRPILIVAKHGILTRVVLADLVF